MKKTIFVVGAGSGLGNAVARLFAEHGFKAVLIARNAERLSRYAEEFARDGIEVDTQAADASDFGAFAEIWRGLVERHGTPDTVFYNVGITVPDGQRRIDAETLVSRYAADVAGAYHCIRLADTDEFARKRGAILVTGGGLALHPYAGYLPLSMDKAALRAMVLALSPVLAEKGIYIGTVQVSDTIGSNERYAPARIAEEFWKLYESRAAAETVY